MNRHSLCQRKVTKSVFASKEIALHLLEERHEVRTFSEVIEKKTKKMRILGLQWQESFCRRKECKGCELENGNENVR